MTYFDHDHRERENDRFLAAWPFLLQNLRCSPSWGVAVLARGTQYGIQVLGDFSEAKIGDAYATGVIYKDVLLAGRKYSSEMKCRLTAYSLEIPMNHIAGVEITKALGGVG